MAAAAALTVPGMRKTDVGIPLEREVPPRSYEMIIMDASAQGNACFYNALHFILAEAAGNLVRGDYGPPETAQVPLCVTWFAAMQRNRGELDKAMGVFAGGGAVRQCDAVRHEIMILVLAGLTWMHHILISWYSNPNDRDPRATTRSITAVFGALYHVLLKPAQAPALPPNLHNNVALLIDATNLFFEAPLTRMGAELLETSRIMTPAALPYFEQIASIVHNMFTKMPQAGMAPSHRTFYADVNKNWQFIWNQTPEDDRTRRFEHLLTGSAYKTSMAMAGTDIETIAAHYACLFIGMQMAVPVKYVLDLNLVSFVRGRNHYRTPLREIRGRHEGMLLKGGRRTELLESYDGHASKTRAFGILRDEVYQAEGVPAFEPSSFILRRFLAEYPGVGDYHFTVLAHAAFICHTGLHYTAAAAFRAKTGIIDPLFALPQREQAPSPQELARWGCYPVLQFPDPQERGGAPPTMPIYNGLGGDVDTQIRAAITTEINRHAGGRHVSQRIKKEVMEQAFAVLRRRELCDAEHKFQSRQIASITDEFERMKANAIAVAGAAIDVFFLPSGAGPAAGAAAAGAAAAGAEAAERQRRAAEIAEQRRQSAERRRQAVEAMNRRQMAAVAAAAADRRRLAAAARGVSGTKSVFRV